MIYIIRHDDCECDDDCCFTMCTVSMLAHMFSSCENQVTTTKGASTLSVLIQKRTQLHLSSTLFKSGSCQVTTTKGASTLSVLIQKRTQLHLSSTLFKSGSWSMLNCCFWHGMASDQDQTCILTITYSQNFLCKLKIYPRKQEAMV